MQPGFTEKCALVWFRERLYTRKRGVIRGNRGGSFHTALFDRVVAVASRVVVKSSIYVIPYFITKS